MLAESLVERVCQLLADGKLSQRQIALLTGVSRGIVGALARGVRPRGLRPKCADDDPLRPSGPPARCRGCGGMVYMPCQLCRVRAARAVARRLKTLSA
jgi:hypothetical protein